MKSRTLDIEYSKLKNLTIRLTPEFHKMLKRYAFEHDMSMAYVVETATKKYIKENRSQ